MKLAEAEKKTVEACEVVDKTKDINVTLLKRLNEVSTAKDEEIIELKDEVSRLKMKVSDLEGASLTKEAELTRLRGNFSVAHNRDFKAERECSYLQRSLDALRARFEGYHERVIEHFKKSRSFQVVVSKLYCPAYLQGYQD